MNCNKCNIPMEEGQYDATIWIKKGITKLQRWLVGKTLGYDRHYTIAFRCPNCKKIEIYTEDVKENIK